MSALDRLLRNVRRRLGLNRFIKSFARSLFWWAWLPALLVLGDRLFYLRVDASVCAGVTILLALLTGLAAIARRPFSPLNVALAIDDRLGLRERLSTAVSLTSTGVNSEAARAVIADAEQRAAAVDPRTAFPLCLSRRAAWLALPLAATLLLAGLMPRLDLLQRKRREDQQKQETARVREEAVRLAQHARRLRRVAETIQMGEATRVVERMDALSRQLRDPSVTPKQALSRLSDLSDEIKSRRESYQKAKDLSRAMKETRGLEQTRDLAEKIKQGEYAKAADAVKNLMEKLRQGKLSEAETQKLGRELKRLAEMMKKDAPELAKALENAQRCLAKAGGLTAEQLNAVCKQLGLAREQLAAMQQMMQAGQMLEIAENALEECKRCMGGGKIGRCGVCGRRLGEFGICGACQGVFASGGLRRRGAGMGGPGIGRGGIPPFDESDPVGFKDAAAKGMLGKGKILASMRVKGVPQKGEAAAAYADVYAAYRKEAEEALSREPIPLGYKEVVRDYFDKIEPVAPSK